jgi:two-component system LytT family sensor kinase
MAGHALSWGAAEAALRATSVSTSSAPPAQPLVSPLLRRRLVWATGPTLGLFSVLTGILSSLVMGHELPDAEAHVWRFASGLTWSPMLAVCLRWSERRPIVAEAVRTGLAWHAARAVSLSFASALSYYLVRWVGEHAFGTQPFDIRSTVALFLGAWILADTLIYGIVLTGVSVAAAQRRLRLREQEGARLEVALARTEAHLLRAQLDPHFLFNALHSVAGLVHRDPDRADRVLCALGDFLRRSLETAGLEEVTLEQELSHLAAYLEIQRIRFPDRLRFDVTIEDDTRTALLPNLLLQPLVENVVKHAVAVRAEPVTSRLVARRDGEQLVIRIEDDGPGPGAARREGIGLSSSRARLARLHGAGSTIELTALTPRGTVVEVRCVWTENSSLSNDSNVRHSADGSPDEIPAMEGPA